jgi:hypothetical protein
MRRATKQTLKLRLLAFVLALAIVWYSFNPISTSITRRKRDDELPDEKKRNIEPHRMPAILPLAFRPIRDMAEPLPSPDEDEDDFEWPEFIDG